MIRGICAGSIGAALVSSALAIGPAIASGAEGTPSAPSSASAEGWPMPTVKNLQHLLTPLRLPSPRHHHRARASRTSTRVALSPQEIARAMLLRQGGDEAQWNCLDELWGRESRWQPTASNSSSGAYGIPQALPAWKMAAAGSDWRTNPVTQIKWGLSYIADKYGTPCVALSHSNSYGYY